MLPPVLQYVHHIFLLLLSRLWDFVWYCLAQNYSIMDRVRKGSSNWARAECTQKHVLFINGIALLQNGYWAGMGCP